MGKKGKGKSKGKSKGQGVRGKQKVEDEAADGDGGDEASTPIAKRSRKAKGRIYRGRLTTWTC